MRKTPSNFGERVRLARAARHMSQIELAEAVGAIQSTVSKIENGGDAGADTAAGVRIAKLLKIQVNGGVCPYCGGHMR